MDTGISRRIDDLGRVVVPAETRRLLGIKEGDELAFAVEDGAIVLRKLEATCALCGSTDEVTPFKGRGVCQACSSELANRS